MNVVQATLHELSVHKHPVYVIIVLQKKKINHYRPYVSALLSPKSYKEEDHSIQTFSLADIRWLADGSSVHAACSHAHYQSR